jgi:hypothetical protein
MLTSRKLLSAFQIKDEYLARLMEMDLEIFKTKAHAKAKRDMFSPQEFELFIDTLSGIGISLITFAVQEYSDIKKGRQYVNTNLQKNSKLNKVNCDCQGYESKKPTNLVGCLSDASLLTSKPNIDLILTNK